MTIIRRTTVLVHLALNESYEINHIFIYIQLNLHYEYTVLYTKLSVFSGYPCCGSPVGRERLTTIPPVERTVARAAAARIAATSRGAGSGSSLRKAPVAPRLSAATTPSLRVGRRSTQRSHCWDAASSAPPSATVSARKTNGTAEPAPRQIRTVSSRYVTSRPTLEGGGARGVRGGRWGPLSKDAIRGGGGEG